MKLCAVCQTPLGMMKNGRRPQERFCSTECLHNQWVARSKVCAHCGAQRPREMFSVDRSQRDGLRSWCRTCRRTDARDAEDRGPWEWDGVSRYNGVRYGVLRPYQVVCLQAGHLMARVRLTEFQAARIVILGFRTRCGVCGGFLLLESDEDGRIGGQRGATAICGGLTDGTNAQEC